MSRGTPTDTAGGASGPASSVSARTVRPAEPGATGPGNPRRRRGLAAVLHAFDDAPTLSYYVILACVLLLLGIGVLMVLSASTITSLRQGLSPYGAFLNQARFALVGLVGMVIAMRLPISLYRRFALPFLLATLALQLLVFAPGLGAAQGGNQNWVALPGIGTVQPSEVVKLGLCLWLGAHLSTRVGRLKHWREVLWPGLAVSGVAVGLVLLGHDMGTVIVLVALVAAVYWFAGLDVRWFLAAAGLAAVVLPVLVLSSPSRVRRVLSFLGLGEDDPTGTGFQSQHGLWALGTGGISGVGLGGSREKWVPLPEAHNDFIFAIIGEELGLLGALLVLALFACLGWAMLRLSMRHPDPFVRLATAGIMAWILTQAFVNIGVVIGVLPVIGIPLPLVSAGGSAMVSTLAAMGVVLAFARSEPGAREALAARQGTVRRSVAVLGRRAGDARGPAAPARRGAPTHGKDPE